MEVFWVMLVGGFDVVIDVSWVEEGEGAVGGLSSEAQVHCLRLVVDSVSLHRQRIREGAAELAELMEGEGDSFFSPSIYEKPTTL